MFCKHCGEQISDDAEFCEHCGKPLKTQSYHSKKNVPVYRYKKIDRKGMIRIAAVAAAVLIILFGVLFVTKKGDKKKKKEASTEVVIDLGQNGQENGQENGQNGQDDGQESVTDKSAADEKSRRAEKAGESLSEEEKAYLGIYLDQYASCAGENGVSLHYLNYTVADIRGSGTSDFCVFYYYEQSGKRYYGFKFWTSDQQGTVSEANSVTGISAERLGAAGESKVEELSVSTMLFYEGGNLDLTGAGEYFVRVGKENVDVKGISIPAEGNVIGIPYADAPGEYRVVTIDKKGNVTEVGNDQTLYETLEEVLKGNEQAVEAKPLTVVWKSF